MEQAALGYDPNGNLLSARGKVTGYAPDAMDRVQMRTDPRGKPETYAYDANGNLRTATDRKNQPTTITYDALDRPSQFAYADGSSTTLTWDAGNRRGVRSTFKTDQSGRVKDYQEWNPSANSRNPNPFESGKRYRGEGRPHFDKGTRERVEPPPIHEPDGRVRPARPDEIPRGK
jgi:YD repeat-containing protein